MFHWGGYSTLDWWVPTRVNSRAGRLWQDPVRYYQGRRYESFGRLSVPIPVSVCRLSLERFLTEAFRKPFEKNFMTIFNFGCTHQRKLSSQRKVIHIPVLWKFGKMVRVKTHRSGPLLRPLLCWTSPSNSQESGPCKWWRHCSSQSLWKRFWAASPRWLSPLCMPASEMARTLPHNAARQEGSAGHKSTLDFMILMLQLETQIKKRLHCFSMVCFVYDHRNCCVTTLLTTVWHRQTCHV